MRMASRLAGCVVCFLIFVTASEVMAQPDTRKVRIRNQLGHEIKVFVISANPNVRFHLTIPAGQQRTQDGVTPLPRGVVVFDARNNMVIATGRFNFPVGLNIAGVVTKNPDTEEIGVFFEPYE